MSKATILFKTGVGEVYATASPGANLLEVAQLANVAIDAPCGGNGSCGKCRIRVLEGNLEATDTVGHSPAALGGGWYLACKSAVVGDVTIELPEATEAWRHGIKVSDDVMQGELDWAQLEKTLQSEGLESTFGYEVVSLELSPPTADDTTSDLQRLSDGLARALETHRAPLVPLALVQTLPELLRSHDFKLSCLLSYTARGLKLIAVLPPEQEATPLALACDIGTTSVSVILLDLLTGKARAQASSGNGQIRYGADVINRIIAQTKPGGIHRLQKAIVQETLNPLILAVCKKADADADRIAHMSIACNTTMAHLLLGVEADYLRKDPYIPCFYDIEGLRARDIGLALSPFAPLYLAPSVGSYVGGDITAGLLASEVWNSEELSLFIDLGTNGELVFGNNEFLVTCACSAGPAFEGGDIRSGMRATDGAIEAVTIAAPSDALSPSDAFAPSLTVIGGGKPVGICGSGLIDLVSELYKAGAINGKGRFIAEGARFVRDEYGIGSYIVAFPEDSHSGHPIVLTEVDLENFIRAKGAIFSAIMVMLEATGFSVEDLASVITAGGIGSSINIVNAITIGLFPDIAHERYTYLGNTSLLGARAMAVSNKAREKVGQIQQGMTYLELSSEPGYMDAFVAACFIPHTDETLFPSLKV